MITDINVTLGGIPRIEVALDKKPALAAGLGGVTVKPEVVPMDEYDGEYLVTPSNIPQTLETAEKYLRQNVEVTEVPYYEVTNNAGGITAIIGG